ncbi:MAG: hypothetical protein ABIH09_02050 [Candidatus Omnitrophota bacterium]
MSKIIETKTDLKETNIIQQEITKALKVTVIREIRTMADYELCGSKLRTLSGLMKQWEAARKKLVFHPQQAVKTIQEWFSTPMDRMREQKAAYTYLLRDYDAKLEAEREEEQRKLDAETERKRKKKEAQARAWEEKERKAREEADRLAKKGQKDKAAKLLKEADRAEEKAEERMEEAEEVEEFEVIKEKAPEGITFRKKYYGEVENFDLLPDEFKTVNQGLLNKAIQEKKGNIQIPGVKVLMQKITATRGI